MARVHHPFIFFIKEDLENNNYSEEIMQADTLPNEEHTNSEAQQNSSDEGPAPKRRCRWNVIFSDSESD